MTRADQRRGCALLGAAVAALVAGCGGPGSRVRPVAPLPGEVGSLRVALPPRPGAIDPAALPFVSRGGKHRRWVALTFDDGPAPITPRFLRELHRLHVPATFFVVGQQIATFPKILREEVRAGVSLGDHTENHVSLSGKPGETQVKQVEDGLSTMRSAGAPPVILFRPPYGTFDPTTVAVLHRFDLVNVVWTIDSADYTLPGVRQIVRNVMRAVRPGAIVLMHDGGGPREQTLAAVPFIVHRLRRRGYRLVTVTRLLRDSPPSRQQVLPPHVRFSMRP